jgi:AsmA protein
MSKSLKNILVAIVGLIGLLILSSVVLFIFVDTNVYKSRLERAASEALGMEVHVGGRLGIGFSSGLHVRLADVHVGNQGVDVASAREARLKLALLPLLHKKVRIQGIGLQGPKFSVKRDRDGQFNFEQREKAQGTFPALVLDHLSLSDGAFLYEDEQSGEGFEVENINLDVRSLRIAGANSAELLKNLSFTAEFVCREIRTKGLVFSDVKFTCKGQDGIFTLNPVTMRFFGGQGSGSIDADFSDPVPRYSVRSSLSQFRIEEYFKTLSSKKVAEGSMDFSASLSMQGNTAKEIMQTAGGEVSLRGENLTLYGHDLDQELARYESSQNFNLVDVGAFFFAGPIGLAVTKGYNFGSIFEGSGGSSSIGTLFSNWKVERGIAQAGDVAMATKKNRIALKGSIDFVNEQFDDVTIALIDAKGCARVKQKIHGPFQKPVVEKPSVLMSLAGPTLNLLKQASDLVTGGTAEVFYTGSLPAPK